MHYQWLPLVALNEHNSLCLLHGQDLVAPVALVALVALVTLVTPMALIAPVALITPVALIAPVTLVTPVVLVALGDSNFPVPSLFICSVFIAELSPVVCVNH